MSKLLWLVGVVIIVAVGGCTGRSPGRPSESLGTVVWVGDASYVVGTPSHGMRAGSSRRVPMAEVRVQLDGHSEPVSYASRTGSVLRRLAPGQRVRVAYRRESSLFGHELVVTGVTPADRAEQR